MTNDFPDLSKFHFFPYHAALLLFPSSPFHFRSYIGDIVSFSRSFANILSWCRENLIASIHLMEHNCVRRNKAIGKRRGIVKWHND